MAVLRSIVTSLRRFPGLVIRHGLTMPRRRVLDAITIGSHDYRVFRETALDAGRVRTDPAVLVVGFRLRVVGESRLRNALFRRVCLLTTPFWAGTPGFSVKLWLEDRGSNRYAGAYEWDDAASAEAYAASLTPVLQAVSLPGSVWHRVYPHTSLAVYLQAGGADKAA